MTYNNINRIIDLENYIKKDYKFSVRFGRPNGKFVPTIVRQLVVQVTFTL